LDLDNPGENKIEAAIQPHSGNADTTNLGLAFGFSIGEKP
jgi:hypothetical protein